MRTKCLFILLCLLELSNHQELLAQESSDSVAFSGQLVSWAGINFSDPGMQHLGIRYLPSFSYEHKTKQGLKLDFEASANAYSNIRFGGFKFDTLQSNLKPYRLSGRISSDQWEIRLGLQKISFGSASILRPLMWFDKMDPRDPLKFTEGVYGILGRYYFLNNANIWLWGLYGNTEPRGWEIAGTSKKRPEAGGRIQLPVPAGEAAFSYNYRTADSRALSGFMPSYAMIPENKFGFDLKLDLLVGCWLEGSWVNKNKDLGMYTNQEIINFGLDYTFGLGNGLYLIYEQLFAAYDEKAFDFQNKSTFSLFSLSYPVSLFDTLGAMIYYDWKSNTTYNFVNWQKQFNRISIYFMGYWNPDNYLIPAQGSGENLFAGKGVQLMLVWNH